MRRNMIYLDRWRSVRFSLKSFQDLCNKLNVAPENLMDALMPDKMNRRTARFVTWAVLVPDDPGLTPDQVTEILYECSRHLSWLWKKPLFLWRMGRSIDVFKKEAKKINAFVGYPLITFTPKKEEEG